MNYRVQLLARDRQDLDETVAWIARQSPEGAERWVASFESAIALLEQNPFVAPIAGESQRLRQEVRHILFRTKAGRTYRALFVVVGEEVRILRIRGSGQPPITRRDIEP